MAEGALALGAEASRVRRSALRVSPTAAGGGEEVTAACCHTAFISPSYRPPAYASPMLLTLSLAMHVMTLGQTLCGHQVDRQHQNLCTELPVCGRGDAKVRHVNSQKLKFLTVESKREQRMQCVMCAVSGWQYMSGFYCSMRQTCKLPHTICCAGMSHIGVRLQAVAYLQPQER